jgi:hypothetical protein
MLAIALRPQENGPTRPPASLAAQLGHGNVWSRSGRKMADERKFGSVGRDYPRKDGVARVVGAERYTVDGYSSGVASSNARYAPIPVSEVV